MDILAERMKQLRTETNIKQEDLAAELGLSISAYRRYEWGAREPGASVVRALAAYFHVSADWLLGLTDERH